MPFVTCDEAACENPGCQLDHWSEVDGYAVLAREVLGPLAAPEVLDLCAQDLRTHAQNPRSSIETAKRAWRLSARQVEYHIGSGWKAVWTPLRGRAQTLLHLTFSKGEVTLEVDDDRVCYGEAERLYHSMLGVIR